VKGCGLDPATVRVINIDPAGSPPALINRRVDAIAGFAQDYVPSVEFRGQKPPRVLWYADCGVNVVSNGIIVHNDLITAEPKLISDFVATSVKGFLYGREHSEEAAQIIKQYSQATVPAISRREMEFVLGDMGHARHRRSPAGLYGANGLGLNRGGPQDLRRSDRRTGARAALYE
jgi:NitT/TauT family transport system substrate-binding protein